MIWEIIRLVHSKEYKNVRVWSKLMPLIIISTISKESIILNPLIKYKKLIFPEIYCMILTVWNGLVNLRICNKLFLSPKGLLILCAPNMVIIFLCLINILKIKMLLLMIKSYRHMLNYYRRKIDRPIPRIFRNNILKI